MKLMRHTKGLLLLTVAILLAACTTQKRKSDQSFMSKLWHNTTAHFNGYFNAEELLTASVLQLEEQHEDNYNQLLDMYEYVAVDNPQAVAGDLDEAIKKVTVVVNLHPYSNWTDDCYLLAGKAEYLKQDYESAEKTFRYLVNEFTPQDLRDGLKDLKKKSTKKKTAKDRSKERAIAKKEREQDAKEKKKERELTTKQKKKARLKAAKQRSKERKQKKKDRERWNKAKAKARKKGLPAPPKPASLIPKPDPNEVQEGTQPVEEETAKPAEEEEENAEEENKPGGMITLGKDEAAQLESDPESYFMKHRPAYQEGVYWLARTLIERDKYEDARRLLKELAEDTQTFKDVKREVIATQAYLAIKQRDYESAIVRLDNAIEESKKKQQRARFAYIKAQLYQKQGNSQAAYAAFEQVIKNKPEYVMEFGARLNMAQNAWLSGQGSADEALANLDKMLKDEKNINYRDQIYYAMADIELRRGNKEEGIKLLRNSLARSLSNRSQKAEAYYRLGNLYFEDEDFVSAKNYFDSTLIVMGPNDERYQGVVRYRDNLEDIAKNLELIELQDSLLQIAELSEIDKKKLAQKLLEEQRATEAKAKQPNPNRPTPGRTVARPALQKESSFFAYDDRQVKRGTRSFQQRWGDRPLEDNWRRRNRRDAGSDVDQEIATEEEVPDITDEELQQVLADVPQKEEDKEKVKLIIKDAMFDLGRLYRDRLQNNPKAVEILEELNRRFPKNLHELESWYYLYLAHTDLGQTSKAAEYKRKITDRYPTSHFAKMLNDPNYAAEFLSEERKLAREYDATYDLFQDGSFELVYSRAEQAIAKLQAKHTLKPKYALLRAMSVGNIEGKDAYIKELRKVVATYPETPEQTRAKEILRLLGDRGARLPGEVAAATNSKFKANPKELHYIIVVFDNADIDLNANKVALSDYNRSYHKLEKIRISNVYLGEKNDVPVLVMRRFKNQEKAMDYFEGVQKNAKDFINKSKVPHRVFPVTQSNYRQILTARTVEGYETFFLDNY